jgi:hypothetical protein
VSRVSAKALEELAMEALRQALELLPLLAAESDALVDALAARGLTDPAPEDVLAVAEEMADRVDLDRALQRAPPPLRALVELCFSLASAGLGGEALEKLTPEGVRGYALESGNRELLSLLDRYPKLSARVIAWLRARLARR